MTRGRRLLLAAIVALAILSFGLIVGVLVMAKPLARSMVIEAALSHGVELNPSRIDVGWGWVRLLEAEVELVGTPGVRAHVKRATVDLDWFSPSRVEARGVSLSLTGSPADFTVDLGIWGKKFPESLVFPIVAQEVSVEWREREGAKPWLTLDGGLMMPMKDGGQLKADHATVLGLEVGPIGATWGADQASVAFGFGDPNPNAALVRMEISRSTGKARLMMKSIELAALEQPLGVRMPIDGKVMVEGTAELSLEPNEGGEIEGVLQAKLRGYVPPHPPDLSGIVFGDVTTFETGLRLSADRRIVHLEKSRIVAGAFALQGGGMIHRKSDHGIVKMNFSGNIPCKSLAKSAAVSRLGQQFGGLLGDAARRVLAGSVKVGVQITADTRELDKAKVVHNVTVGCSLGLL